MSTTPIDLSAGLQPAAASPANGSIDLSAGLQPAAAPAQTAPAPAPTGDDAPGWRGMANRLLDPVEGLGEGVLDTAATVARGTHALGEKIHPGLGEYLAPQDGIDQLQQAAHPDNTAQSVGKGMESVAEYMMGDEALKGLTQADKAAKVASAMTKIEKSPTMMRVMMKAAKSGLASGARQGAVGTVQALAHGASGVDALKAGAIAGATGGLLEGGSQAVGDTYRMIRPRTGSIDGIEFPKLASQEPGGSKIGGSTAANTPEFGDAQQAAGQKVIVNNAQRATRDALERVNQSRTPLPQETNPARLLETSDRPTPYQFEIRTGEAPEQNPNQGMLYTPQRQVAGFDRTGEGIPPTDPQYPGTPPAAPEGGGDEGHQDYASEPTPVQQYLTGIKPGEAKPLDIVRDRTGVLRTSDPHTAQTALSRLNELDEAGGLSPAEQAGRDSLQQQLDMYHVHRNAAPDFEQIDSAAAAKNVSSYGEAADQIRASVRPVYQRLDKLSGGDFEKFRNQQRAALKVIQNGSTVDAIDAAHARLAEAEKGIEGIIESNRPNLKRADFDAAQSAWRDSKILDQVHANVEGMYNGISQADAAATGIPRKITNASLRKIGNLVSKVPRAELNRVIGNDGVQNLYRVADLLGKPDTAAKTFKLLHSTAHYAGRGGAGALIGAAGAEATGHKPLEGGAAGLLVGLGGRAALRSMATNGRVGQLVEYAIKNNVDGKIAIPLIAGTMAHAARQDTTSTGATTDDPADGVAPN